MNTLRDRESCVHSHPDELLRLLLGRFHSSDPLAPKKKTRGTHQTTGHAMQGDAINHWNVTKNVTA